MLYAQTSLNCGGRLLSLASPLVMGILNVTPDSFFSGSRLNTIDAVLRQAERQLAEGAAILDMGGMSTRPRATMIVESEERQRVIPAIEAVAKAFPEAIISVDTFRSDIAKAAVEAGASLINDISGGNFDPKMYETVANLGVPYVLMHIQGTPETMQDNPQYEDVALEILDFLIQKVGILRGLGVKDIVIDVGFGFGKTIEQNYELLRKLSVFKILECPMLVGLSRKGMIWRPLSITPEEAMNGTTAANVLALMNGANILRVHDVKAAVEAIKIVELYKGQ
jgi:dihydropteroate synthase